MNEIGLVFFQEIKCLAGVVRAGERIWIVPLREPDHFHLEPFFQQHVYTPDGSPDPGIVPVIKHGDLLCETFDQPDLFNGQRCPRRGDNVRDSGLEQRDDIRIALNKIAFPALHDILFCIIDPVQGAAFVIDLAIGGVDVFGHLLVAPEGPSPKAYDPSAQRMDREYDTVLVAVHEGFRFVIAFRKVNGQTCGNEQFRFVSGCKGCPGEGVFAGRGITQLKMPDHVLGKPAFPEVAQPGVLPGFFFPQVIGIEITGIAVDQQKAVPSQA